MIKIYNLILLICTVFSSEWEYEDSVLVLTEENFDKALEEFPNLLAEFYAPWCGHCKTLAPQYAKAAQHFEKENVSVKLAKIDATIHRTLADRFKVTGFPTLKFFKHGHQMEYNGGRKDIDIIRWIEKKMGDASQKFSLEEVMKKKETQVVIAYWGPEDSNF